MTEKSIFTDHAENDDFAFFRILESTIVGVASFCVRLWNTFRYSLLKPRLFSEIRSGKSTGPSLVRPYTYLWLALIVVDRLYGWSQIYEENDIDSLKLFLSESSIFESIALTLPVIIVSILLGFALSILLKKYVDSRKEFVELHAMSIGTTIHYLVLFFLIGVSIEHLLGWAGFLEVVYILAGLIAGIGISGNIVFFTLKFDAKDTLRRKVVVYMVVQFFCVLIFGLVIFVQSQIADSHVLNSIFWEEGFDNNRIAQCSPTEKWYYDSDNNSYYTTFILSRNPNTSGDLFISKEAIFPKVNSVNDELRNVVAISSWQDGDTKVLTLLDNKPKWVTVSLGISEDEVTKLIAKNQTLFEEGTSFFMRELKSNSFIYCKLHFSYRLFY